MSAGVSCVYAAGISFDVRAWPARCADAPLAAMLFVASMMVHPLACGSPARSAVPRANCGTACLLLLGTLGWLHRLLAARRPALRHRHPRCGRFQSRPRRSWARMSFFPRSASSPGESIIPRSLHRPRAADPRPAARAALGAHAAAACAHKHTQWLRSQPHREERRRLPDVPGYAAKAGGFFPSCRRHGCCRRAAVDQPGGEVRPHDPLDHRLPAWTSVHGWSDGALRIMPGIETPHLGVTISGTSCCRSSCCLMLAVHRAAAVCRPSTPPVPADKRDHHHCFTGRANAPTRTALDGGADDDVRPVPGAGGNDIIATAARVDQPIDVHFHAGSGPSLVRSSPSSSPGGGASRCSAGDNEAAHGYETGIIMLPPRRLSERHPPLPDAASDVPASPPATVDPVVRRTGYAREVDAGRRRPRSRKGCHPGCATGPASLVMGRQRRS